MQPKIQELTHESFSKYGTYASLLQPVIPALAAGQFISFWPDWGGVLDLGPAASNQLAIGVCQVCWRPLQVDVSEFHTATGEGNLPLDGDIIIHVAPPTADDKFPLEQMEIFRVPQGTMVILKAGVWHHAPFAIAIDSVVNTVILLPQRTYANDCVVKELTEPITFI